MDNKTNQLVNAKEIEQDALNIIKALPIPLLVISTQKTIVFANIAFYKKFHTTPLDTENQKLDEIGNGQWNMASLLEMLEWSFKTDEGFKEFEIEYDFPHIGERNMLLSGSPVHLSGIKQKIILLTIEDLTEKISEVEKIKSSEEKYRNLIISAHEGIMMINDKGKIEFTNEKFDEIFGYDSNELINQPFDIFIPQHHKKIHHKHYLKYMKCPIQREMGKSMTQILGRHKNGSLIHVDISLSPFKTKAGIFVNCMIRDITELKKTERKHIELAEREKELRLEAEKANKMKDDFLTILSHELRTPLTTILTWSQILKSNNLDKEKAQQAFSAIESNALSQGQLIDDLLDVSRIRAGKLRVNLTMTDLSSTLYDALGTVQCHADNKNITIETLVAPKVSDFRVMGDPIRLHQVFWNILSNAVKFTPPKGKIKVTCNLIKNGKKEEFEVQINDNGKGMKADFLPHILKRFSQEAGSTDRIHGGLGLGMAIAHNLVRMHRGTISVKSPGEGKGSTFTINFPAKLPSKTNAAPKDSQNSEDSKIFSNVKIFKSPLKLNNIFICIIDKNKPSRDALYNLLNSLEAKVECFHHYKEAINSIDNSRPQIIINCISILERHKLELVSKIKSSDKYKSIPILALTDKAKGNEIKQLLKSGYNAQLERPADATILSHMINKLVKN